MQRNKNHKPGQPRPAGHKLWVKTLKAKYGKSWRQYADLPQ